MCYNNMNTYAYPRVLGRKEATVWLCIDRIEGDLVVLLDDREKVYHLSSAAYAAMVGQAPTESDVLKATVEDGKIIAAAIDEAETASRKASARARLNRLFGRK